MFFSIRHITRFRYSSPVRESVMELRMQPRSEGYQALRSFQIVTNPRAQLTAYTDHLGNAVYHFNVLREHDELRIDAQSVVEILPARPLPEALDMLEWDRYNNYNFADEHFDLMEPSKYAKPSKRLAQFTAEKNLQRPKGDPLTALKSLNRTIFESFDYQVGVTDVHSPIDDALGAGRGVCQDFAHIMIAIARNWRMPARYVSGYLFHRRSEHDRSRDDATHAWVEVWLPSLGWVGFDPTNDLLVGDRHIRTSVGRDYADVPPTRGTFKGPGDTELGISVSVEPTQAPIRHEEFLRVSRPLKPRETASAGADPLYQQQQ